MWLAIEQMTKTIIENSSNARQTADKAEQARCTAEQGLSVVHESADGMRQMSDVVHKSAAMVETLGHSSSRISAIVSVISDIAQQTNLLALNAAIEAARAGESGRGFAVVADEVRKLAERTSTATTEISSMISGIQNEIQRTVEAIGAGREQVDKGLELSDQTAAAFNAISAAVKDVASMISAIAIACEEQSSVSESISRSVQMISSVSNETESGSRTVAMSADELYQLTENLQTLIARFQLQSDLQKSDHDALMTSDAGVARHRSQSFSDKELAHERYQSPQYSEDFARASEYNAG